MVVAHQKQLPSVSKLIITLCIKVLAMLFLLFDLLNDDDVIRGSAKAWGWVDFAIRVGATNSDKMISSLG